jgi:hypothetical protein
VVVLVADVGLAWAWFERGAGLLGFELAGAGLAIPVAALLGAMITGTLLFSVQAARATLGTHLGRPFDVIDLPRLARGSVRTAAVLLLVSSSAAAWFALALRGSESEGAAAAATALLVCGLMLASVSDAALRAGQHDTALAFAAVVGVLGLVLTAVPGWSLFPLTELYVAEPMTGVRLCGVVLLQEAALAVVTHAGVLRHRRAEGVELLVTVAVVSVFAAALALLFTPSLPAMAGVLIVARGLVVPLLRSGR